MIFKFWEEQSPNNIIITQLKAAQLKKAAFDHRTPIVR